MVVKGFQVINQSINRSIKVSAYQPLIYHATIYSKRITNSKPNKSAPVRPQVKFTTLLYHPSKGVLLWLTEQWNEHEGDTGPFFSFVIYEQFPNKLMYAQLWSYKLTFIFPSNTVSMYILAKLVSQNWFTCSPVEARGGLLFIYTETRGAGYSFHLNQENCPKTKFYCRKSCMLRQSVNL